LLAAAIAVSSLSLPLEAQAPPSSTLSPGQAGAYSFVLEAKVPVPPERAFDLFTGDVSPWWDHHFVENPKALYIEPKPGGGFYEIFDEKGNGALHANVIYAHRGKRLVLSGPLGFSGFAHEIVAAIDFEALDAGKTRLKVTVHGGGQLQEGWGEAIQGVWHHFLIDRFKPYVECLAESPAPTPPSGPGAEP
jgi:uncharacterized protein YndB with AHSA1/START domain